MSRSDFVVNGPDRYPLRFKVSTFSDNFRVRRSVGSLLSNWYGPLSIRVDILV